MIKKAGVPYWRLSGFYFLFFITVGIYLPYWSLYLKSIGFNAEARGILSAVVVVAKIFSTYLWGWFADHTGKRIQVIQIASFFFSRNFFWHSLYPEFLGNIIFPDSVRDILGCITTTDRSSHVNSLGRVDSCL